MFVGLISLEEGGRNFPWELKSVASQLHQIRRECSGLPSNCTLQTTCLGFLLL